MKRKLLLVFIGLFSLCKGLRAEVHSGNLKEVTWALDTNTGVLMLEGKGEISVNERYNSDKKEFEKENTWLDHKEHITSVKIAEGITTIGQGAFRACTKLKTVLIPNSVVRIGSSAFSECTSLKSLQIPNSVISMGQYVFSGCDSLEYEIESDVKYLSNWAVGVVEGKKSYTIRKGTIGLYETFSDLMFVLEGVSLPDGLKSIGSEAFRSCYNLKNVSIPHSVRNIGLNAFQECI